MSDALLSPTPPASGENLERIIADNGYAFVPGETMRALLAQAGPLADWEAFAASWDRLEVDTYMADRGRYRRRRHAVFSAASGGTIRRAAHQPHYQSTDYNPLNGGIERWFEPIEPDIGGGPSLTAILCFCQRLFENLKNSVVRSLPEEAQENTLSSEDKALSSEARQGEGGQGERNNIWHIEAHQFRIEAREGARGFPTPEGMHRDGVDYVLVLLIRRRNIKSGATMIHGLDRRPLGGFTLTEPFDAALVEDARVTHGVTAVEAIDPAQPAWRDVLVVTFRNIPE